VNIPRFTMSSTPLLAYALEPTGEHHVLADYRYPSGSAYLQDQVYYMTDAAGSWELPELEVVVAKPAATTFAEVRLAPTSLLVPTHGVPEATYSYSLGDVTWAINHAVGSSGSWTVDWQGASSQTYHVFYGSAQNAGVLYAVYRCGYNGDSFCVDRSAGGVRTNRTFAAGAVAASVAVDSAGFGHVLWANLARYSAEGIATLDYATDRSGGWTNTSLVTATSYSFAPQIAVAPDDTIHIVYQEPATKRMLHGVGPAPGFTFDVVTSTDGKFSLAVDPFGVPGVLHTAVAGTTLWRPGAGAWDGDSVPAFGGSGCPLLLRFDAAGKPHAFFCDRGDSSQLRLAWKP
jgi:hypothetical protein